MNNSFNERVFDDTIVEVTKTLKLNKKGSLRKLKMIDVENAIETLLNDEKILGKISREDIIKYTNLLKDEINKTEFGMAYLRTRIEIIKERNNMFSFMKTENNQRKNPFRKLTFDKIFKIVSRTVLNLSKDMVDH